MSHIYLNLHAKQNDKKKCEKLNNLATFPKLASLSPSLVKDGSRKSKGRHIWQEADIGGISQLLTAEHLIEGGYAWHGLAPQG